MDPILELKEICKIYPNGTVANRNVGFSVSRNAIHAIVGENGAGKTTLMKMIFGIEAPTSGSISFRGERAAFSSPNDAIRAGIGMVHQHFMLAQDLTVTENIVLGMEPRKAAVFLDRRSARARAAAVSAEYGLEVPVDAKVRELSVGIKQRVEILKALCRNAELLILDEPTAVLTPQESAILFKTLDTLKRKGKTILFISHKLNEVKAIADSITIMKGGTVVDTRDASELSKERIAELMVGRELSALRVPKPERVGEVACSVRDLRYRDPDGLEPLAGVSFDVRRGEVLGLAGVEGNGQSELIGIMTGLLRPESGSVSLFGAPIAGLSPRSVRELGLSHIPEDRMDDGIAASASIEENLVADRYFKPEFSRAGWIDGRAVRRYSESLIRDFRVLASSPRQPVKSLSGGNIQKAIVARELSSDHGFILAAQPTRGVDVGLGGDDPRAHRPRARRGEGHLPRLRRPRRDTEALDADRRDTQGPHRRPLPGRPGGRGRTTSAPTCSAPRRRRAPMAKFMLKYFSAIRTAIAVLIGVLISVALIYLISADPAGSLKQFFLGPFLSKGRFFNVLENACPLVFCGVAISIAFKAAQFNVGAEGSFYLGAVAGTAVAVSLNLPVWAAALVAILAAAAAGALWGAIPGLLKGKWGANELVSSLMLNYVAYYLGLFVVNYLLRDKAAGFLASKKLPEAAWLPVLVGGTRFHLGIVLALLFAIGGYLLLYRTGLGFELRMTGENAKFARYAGIDVRKVVVLSQVLLGLVAGVGGIVEVQGIHHRFNWQASPGYGWDGVIVAIIGRNNPLLVLLASLFLSYLRVGGQVLNLMADVPAEMVSVIQSVIILLVTAEAFLSGWRFRLTKRAAGMGR